MRRRGIVMEVNLDYAVVLSSDGEFCRVPKTGNVSVGTEITWESVQTDVVRARRARPRFRTWTKVASTGVAACLAIGAGALWSLGGAGRAEADAFAFVSIDINPSVTMEVNHKLVVISADGMNDDGKTLLTKVNLTGQPVQQAVEILVTAAASNGMLPDEDAILISTAPADGHSDVGTVKTQVQSSVETTVQTHPAVEQHHPNVYAIALSNSIWTAADDAHISPGKFAAYVIASTEGKSLSLNELSGQTLNTVLSDAKAQQIAEVLDTHNLKQVDDLLGKLPSLSTAPEGVTGPTTANQTPVPPGKKSSDGNGNPNGESKGSGNGNGHGDSKANGSGNSGKKSGSDTAGKSQNSPQTIEIYLGDRVVTIPVGPIAAPGHNSNSDKRSQQGDGARQSGNGQGDDGQVNPANSWNPYYSNDSSSIGDSVQWGDHRGNGNSNHKGD